MGKPLTKSDDCRGRNRQMPYLIPRAQAFSWEVIVVCSLTSHEEEMKWINANQK